MQILHSLQDKGDKDIVTSQTHGDFQSANILLGQHHTWLIDWEYTAKRQVAYDGLVYTLKSRFPEGLSQRLLGAMTGDSPDCERLLAHYPYVDWQDISKRRSMLALFLLEELDLKLMEICNPVFYKRYQPIVNLENEIKSAIRSINNAV